MNLDSDSLGKNESMMRALSKRSVFSYKYWREAYMRRMSSWYCCCCKSTARRKDRLFKDARSKLYEEIDILEIIKKLRVNKFTRLDEERREQQLTDLEQERIIQSAIESRNLQRGTSFIGMEDEE